MLVDFEKHTVKDILAGAEGVNGARDGLPGDIEHDLRLAVLFGEGAPAVPGEGDVLADVGVVVKESLPELGDFLLLFLGGLLALLHPGHAGEFRFLLPDGVVGFPYGFAELESLVGVLVGHGVFGGLQQAGVDEHDDLQVLHVLVLLSIVLVLANPLEGEVRDKAVGGEKESRTPLDEGFGAEVPHASAGGDGEKAVQGEDDNLHPLHNVNAVLFHNVVI